MTPLPTFIAAQGPLPQSIPHFLQMIIENEVKAIVMLTKLKEKGERKLVSSS
jgi:protein tyrosine phosphatase